MLKLLSISCLLQATVPGTAGIYLTAQDFEQQHLSYQVVDKNLRQPIPAGQMLLKVLTPDGKQLRFAKGSVYGYRKDGKDCRFISEENNPEKLDRARFMVIEARAPLYIYSHTSSGKLFLTKWFYSLTSDGRLHYLTPENLAKDFPANPEMTQEIAADRELGRDMGIRDESGRLRVAKIMEKYLPVPAK